MISIFTWEKTNCRTTYITHFSLALLNAALPCLWTSMVDDGLDDGLYRFLFVKHFIIGNPLILQLSEHL